jgi:hypothetical protein
MARDCSLYSFRAALSRAASARAATFSGSISNAVFRQAEHSSKRCRARAARAARNNALTLFGLISITRVATYKKRSIDVIQS